MSETLTIERINEIIDKEVDYAKGLNQPIMALGMMQIKEKLNSEVKNNG